MSQRQRQQRRGRSRKASQKKNRRQRQASQRTATVNVHYPKHVPNDLRPIWDAAARRVAKAGRLLRPVRTASGETGQAVDYYAVNNVYSRILKAYSNVADDAQNPQ